jgi:hypothetical protein
MKNITNYCIVSDTGIDRVEKAVRELIDTGWQLFSAVAITLMPSNQMGIEKIMYTQTMVKYKEE